MSNLSDSEMKVEIESNLIGLVSGKYRRDDETENICDAIVICFRRNN